MEYIVGCNYWASNAGTEMWKNWDEKAVREDFEILTSHGIRYMRVFPMWRDFQPIIPVMGSGGDVQEYRLDGDRFPENPYYLDPVMLERFSKLCDIAEEYDVKFVVGIITGWMSGRLFIPSAMYGKSIFMDPTALLFQQRFVAGIVSNFKHRKCIYAWDLGNECNVMSQVTNEEAATNWSMLISNAIKANDPTRPVVSGMHGLKAHNFGGAKWTIKGQGEACDMLTTHPYPYFCEHADIAPMATFRTGIHATFQTKMYSDLSGKPCLVEELGNLGPMVSCDEIAADFMRLQLISNWAHKSPGVMWWCANEQTNLTTHPYTAQMCEVELGMIYADRTPKPVLKETKKIGGIIRGFDFELPKAKTDAVCILTLRQDHLAAGYMTYALAKQAGLNIEFVMGNDEIPHSDIYILPSICAQMIMKRENYLEIIRRVKEEGATLYISNETGLLAEFNALAGVKVIDCECSSDRGEYDWNGEKIPYSRSRRLYMDATSAKVLAVDTDGNPLILENSLGKGKVIYVNYPLETSILNDKLAFEKKNFYLVYKKLFESKVKTHEVTSDNRFVGITLHPAEDGSIYCVAVNYSHDAQKSGISIDAAYEVAEVYYGNTEEIGGFDGAVFKIVKK